jgi:hypothetical protein
VKPLYEARLDRKGGSWFLIVTISVDEYYWTSNPVMLDAETEEQAREEGARKVSALRKVLRGS